MKFKDAVKELSHGFRLTTNNRMELLAVITGLETIKKDGIPVTIYSDSKYVVDAIEKGWIGDGRKKTLLKKPTQTCGNVTFPFIKNSSLSLCGYEDMQDIRKMKDAISLL
jgi:ribonuclease HI